MYSDSHKRRFASFWLPAIFTAQPLLSYSKIIPIPKFQRYLFYSKLELSENLVHEYVRILDFSDKMRFLIIYEIE
jgi:hypothetical protein